MTTTHNIVIVPTKKDKKLGYLKLRTIRNRKPKDTSLGFIVQIKNFNKEKQYVYSKESNADEINSKIKEVLIQAQSGKTENFKTTKESFLAYSDRIIEVINSPNTKKSKGDALNKLRKYLSTLNKEDLTYSEIDIFFVRGYYNYLLQNHAISTANEYITVFKYFVNQAIENQIFHYTVDPFQGLQKKKEKRRYRVLTDDELKTFFNHTFTDEYKHYTQHAFGFMMFASGMRVSDFLKLKWKDFHSTDERFFIKYRYKKTNQIHESNLTIEAVKFLRPFLETYKEGSLQFYDNQKLQYDKNLQAIIEVQKEHDDIQPKSYKDLSYEIRVIDNYYELNERVKAEGKKEIQKRNVASRLKAMKDIVPRLEQDLMNAFSSVILMVKDSHDDDFIFPKMREVPKDNLHHGSQSITGSLNYYLGLMQKELNIKTKITNHQARHVFAQRLFVAGANFHFISMALGHSSLAVTENYREQLVTDEARDLSQVFTDTFKPKAPLEDPMKGYVSFNDLPEKDKESLKDIL